MNQLDKGLFFAFIGLTLFGLIMMSSMSVAGSFEITGRNDFYFLRHMFYIVLGVPIFLIAFKFPYDTLRKISPVLFIFAITLLLLVLVIGQDFGTAAKSWLKVGPISFQPTEVAKLAIVIFLAAVYSSGKNDVDSLQGGFMPFVFVLGIPAILIMAQPDFGSLMVITTVCGVMYFVAGANLKHYLGAIIAGLVGATIVVLTNPYIAKRFAVFMNPELDPLGAGFQMKQALIAIGSGGWFGRGFQNSIQKFDYLPEVQSDTIFSAIAEELGFIRILCLLGIYFFIAHRGFFIARNAPDQFTQLLAVGLTTWIVGQAFINIAVNLALFPNTGITLPLLSYGGTSLWATFAAMGILLHISGNIKTTARKRYT
ncbi:putative lipid II flippase FtsW [bacterium]|nr:putative lipid II flippase FtsW [bacterium]NCQ55950.1 putative lipid II flippase FtsW [Candidatus Parcubacteria bacterium]NCS67975.1 putative lipid II flippase FtsW [Candidatus Peregrinibacteria bacterium]NCS96869.1 putative lipid II flippase FtsW [bacterium]